MAVTTKSNKNIEITKDIMVDNVQAVSYTHLDVYKRQTLRHRYPASNTLISRRLHQVMTAALRTNTFIRTDVSTEHSHCWMIC